jgi:hypothetical protein
VAERLKQVGDASPPELEVVDENTGCLHCVRIDEVHRPNGCPTRVFGRKLGMPRPRPELIIGLEGAAGLFGIGPERRRRRLGFDLDVQPGERRQLRSSILARGQIRREAEIVLIPEHAVAAVTSHRDRGAVLAGYCHDTARRLLVLHPVAESRREQVCWTNVPLGIARHTERGRLNAIDLVAGLGIEPLVGDDSGPARMLASEHCGVAGAGFGQAVGLIGVAVNDPFIDETFEPGFEAAAPLVKQRGAELVDGDENDEIGLRLAICRPCRCGMNCCCGCGDRGND